MLMMRGGVPTTKISAERAAAPCAARQDVRNFLADAIGNAINLILATTGHNLRLLRAWLIRLFVFLLCLISINKPTAPPHSAKLAAA
jgi:hypothetical protein